MFDKWLDNRKRAYAQWKVIQEVESLLSQWRYENDDSYRQQAIAVLINAKDAK